MAKAQKYLRACNAPLFFAIWTFDALEF